MTKNKIILISLAVLLVALIVVYFVVIAPLLNTEIEVPEPQDGEGLYNNTLTIFEPIEEKNLVSINVKNAKDEYTFKNVSEGNGKYTTVIKGFEKLIYDNTYFTVLKSYALTPITVGSQVFRNCSVEQMKEYGVTADTCAATLTVEYKDANGEIKTHILRIGYEAFTANPTYYVSIDGRNHVYRFSGTAAVATELALADFVSPVIFSGYKDASSAAMDIKTFSISKGTISDFLPYIVVTNKRIADVYEENGEPTVYYSIDSTFHIMDGSKIVKSTSADYDYALNSMALFYTNLLGDKCIAINPSDAMLDEYGLGKTDVVYIVNAQRQPLTEEDIQAGVEYTELPTFMISSAIYDEEEKASFYYTVAYQGDIPLLVRIPESALVPQNQFKDTESVVFNEAKLLNWAATNTLGAGIKEALDGSIGAKYVGIKSLTVKVPTTVYQFGEETFLISFVYDEEQQTNILKVRTKSGRYEDLGDEKIKPFNQFYATLISHPLASRFNNFEDSVIDEILANPANNLYTLEAVLNPAEGETVSKVQRFEYYKINASTVTSSEYVIIHVVEGYYDGNGNFVEESEKTVFDTTKNQITDYIYKDFVALMEGKLETIQ